MIQWLLRQVERDPTAVFYERDLRAEFGSKVDRALTDALLTRLPLPSEGDSFLSKDGTRFELRTSGTGWEAIAVEADDIEVTNVGVEDVQRCQVDLGEVAAKMRDANRLVGAPPTALDDARRLHFLGEHGEREERVAWVLGLLADELEARQALLGLRACLPAGFEEVVVACPTYEPSPALERQLESLKIETARIDENGLAVRRRRRQAETPERSGFRHSADFRTINFGEVEYPLTTRQAQVVELLYKARRSATSSLSHAYLMEETGSPGTRLRDLFRDSPLWGTLIVGGTSKGTARLNI